MINLELLNALNTSHNVLVPVHNKFNKELTQKNAVDHWMRHKKGHGWIIVDIDVHTFANIFWEETTSTYLHKYLGGIKPNESVLGGMQSPTLLCMVETDKYTPTFILELANNLVQLPSSRLLVLERQGY